MPELPEVETVCRGLESSLKGQRLTRLEMRRPDLRFPLPPELPSLLEGRRLLSVTRRAKYMLMDFEGAPLLLGHLGMSGRMLITDTPPEPAGKHDHLLFTFEEGALTFQDPRRFGFFDLVPDAASHPRLKDLGPEPLGNSFSAAYLQERFAGKKQSLKSAIMDARIVVGVGNIYASESLFLAGLSPWRAAGTLGESEIAALVSAIRETLARAIEAGGSSLNDYVQASGELGYFQHQWKVYGRAGEPCRSCGTPVIKAVQSQRSTFACPACQAVSNEQTG